MRKGKLCFIPRFLILFYWPNAVSMIFGINDENIPVALVQGELDGTGTPYEMVAAIKVLDRPSELISIPGANHYFSNLIVSGWKY